MQRADRLTCPSCGTPLKSGGRGIRIGRKITCPKCHVAFAVRPEDAERAAEVNFGRLTIVMVGAALFLVGGASLGVYCFANNSATQQITQAGTQQPGTEQLTEISTALPQVKPPLSPVTPAEERQIDEAIAKGVWYLRDHVLPQGNWPDTIGNGQVSVGFTSLPALTLLECGVPANEAVIQKAAQLVRQQAPAQHAAYGTYQQALAILFLDRLGDKQDEGLIQYLALSVIAGQHPTGGSWTYFCPTLDRYLVPQLAPLLKDDKQTLLTWRARALQNAPLPPANWDNNAKPPVPTNWDNSNTQFAVLALWVAQRHGIAIDKSIDLAEKKHFRPLQMGPGADPEGNYVDLDGSWYYDQADPRGWRNSSRWPSMTCAGLLALAAAHGVTKDPTEKKQKPLDDDAIKRGLDVLAREIDRPGESRPVDLYFLWSLERVAVLFELAKIGGKDWYAWGRKILLPAQDPDGSWKQSAYYGSNPLLNTCFALLFLKQANLAKDLTDKLQWLAAVVGAQSTAVGKKE
jgi:hypothetical protein